MGADPRRLELVLVDSLGKLKFSHDRIAASADFKPRILATANRQVQTMCGELLEIVLEIRGDRRDMVVKLIESFRGLETSIGVLIDVGEARNKVINSTAEPRDKAMNATSEPLSRLGADSEEFRSRRADVLNRILGLYLQAQGLLDKGSTSTAKRRKSSWITASLTEDLARDRKRAS